MNKYSAKKDKPGDTKTIKKDNKTARPDNKILRPDLQFLSNARPAKLKWREMPCNNNFVPFIVHLNLV